MSCQYTSSRSGWSVYSQLNCSYDRTSTIQNLVSIIDYGTHLGRKAGVASDCDLRYQPKCTSCEGMIFDSPMSTILKGRTLSESSTVPFMEELVTLDKQPHSSVPKDTILLEET